MNILLKEEGKEEISLERYKEVFKFPVIDYYRELGVGLTDEEFYKIGKKFIVLYEASKFNCNLYEDIMTTITFINKSNIKQSVLSAYSQDKLIDMLKHYELFNYMENILGQNNIYAEGKIELGEKLIKKINEPANSILMIGDTDHDFEVAEKMGIDCILLNRGHQNIKQLEKTNAVIIENLAELAKIMEK